MPKRHHSLARTLAAMTASGSLLVALPVLTGCGQKGPLMLPSTKPTPTAPAASSPSRLQ
jgi:predicted small lipoprotein YifL